METKQTQYRRILSKYLPKEFVEEVVSLLVQFPVKFKIVKPRKTKLGDFRAGINYPKHQITINGNLNPYSFLITTIHEFAHLITHDEYGGRISPHGIEWKNNYTKLLMPIINSKKLPADIERSLLKSLISVKASSCSDMNLHRTLIKYDGTDELEIRLESLDKNSTFELNDKIFVKGILRRTRFMCTEKSTGRKYLVSALAKVKEIKNEE